ncbi:MAG TPA: ABC transporter permease [Gaiellaceae bacterium]|jgi:putative hydroxymethylpyrimidine transport system permease protein
MTRPRRIAPALLLLAATVGVWQLVVRATGTPSWLWPAPSAVARAFADDDGLLARNGWVTLREMLLGFGVAVAVGVGLACALHFSTALRRAVYPILVASQTVPVVVLAPILVVAFGYGLLPKLAIVALVCFFPIVVGMSDGLRSADRQYRRLMLTLDAGRVDLFRRVELPASLPSLFSGLRIAAAYAAIGAVFGEWAGAGSGLGYVMQQAAPALATARIFASVLILTAMALALFVLVTALERVVVPWSRDAAA